MRDMTDMQTHRHERVLIETARHRVHGNVRLPRDGYRSRVSDLLNAVERDFVSLTEATVQRLDADEPPTSVPYLAISRRHIVIAVPDHYDSDDSSLLS